MLYKWAISDSFAMAILSASLMTQLNVYPLPYTAPQPPLKLFRGVETESGRSGTTSFDTGLDGRDVFIGQRECVVCGETNLDILERFHIVRRSDVKAVRPHAIDLTRVTTQLLLVAIAQTVGMGPCGCQRPAGT
jgi:hypothetical protein